MKTYRSNELWNYSYLVFLFRDNHRQIAQGQYCFSKVNYWFVEAVSIQCYSLVFCHSEAQSKPSDFQLKTFRVTGIFHSLFTTTLIYEHWNLSEKSQLYWNHPDFNTSSILESLAHYLHPNVEFQWLSRSPPEPKIRKDSILYFILADQIHTKRE